MTGPDRSVGTSETPAAYLNHLYVVLDSETYKAIETDEFLRHRFAANERRTTVRTDETYSGLYFYGCNTYFEVFDVAESPSQGVGDYALAFGVDETGGIDALRDRFGAELAPSNELITRLYNGVQIPWFYMATVPRFPFRSVASMWLMEYHPDFLTRWNPGSRTGEQGVRRRDILARYADVVGRVNPPALVDVVGVTVEADAAVMNDYAAIGAAAGYRVDSNGSPGPSSSRSDPSTDLVGPDIAIQIVPSAQRGSRIRQIRMRINEGAWTPSSPRVGRATLASGGGYATITLG